MCDVSLWPGQHTDCMMPVVPACLSGALGSVQMSIEEVADDTFLLTLVEVLQFPVVFTVRTFHFLTSYPPGC